MTLNEKRDAVQKLLVNAGVRRDLVNPLSQQLLRLLQPVDHNSNQRKYDCEAAFRFELERSWGG